MIVLVYIVIGLLGLYFFLRPEKKKGKSIPGPKGWPFVGLGFEITPHNMFSKFSVYAQQFGDIFRIKLFGNNIVVLNSAELIRTAYNADPYRYSMNDRLKTFYGEKIMFGSQSITFVDAFGSKHGDLRKHFAQAMRFFGEGREDFENLVQSELNNLTEKIELHQGQDFDLLDHLKHSLVNIMSIVCFGHDLKTEEDIKVFWEIVKADDFFLSEQVDVLLTTFPFLIYVPSVYRERYRKIVNAKAALTKRFYQQSKDTHKPGVVRGIVDFMIEEQKQSQQNGEEALFTDERTIAILLDTIAPGVVTSLSHLSSTLLILMNNPEYQVKIQSEIDTVIGRDRRPTLDDKQQCPFTEAVVLEAHRYFTVVPGLLPHACKSNIEFEGFDIPKNSVIFANVFHVHHDEKIWGDPWTFRPERFLGDSGDIIPSDHPYRKSWLSFGTGRRQCIGESLARSRVFLFLTTFLQRWTFELPPGCQVSCDSRFGEFDYNVTFRPKPFNCRVIPRVSTKNSVSKEAY